MNRIDEDWELINLFRNLRYLRHQKGLSLHGAARQAGMDPRTLQALEAGRLPERWGLRSLFALCDLYGVELSEVFRRLDEGKNGLDKREGHG